MNGVGMNEKLKRESNMCKKYKHNIKATPTATNKNP